VRIIKLGLISVIFLSLLITGISLFFPSRVRISKAVDINSTRQRVLEQIADTLNWKNWYPGIDSINNITITEKSDSSVRAVSDAPGSGSQKIDTGWNIFSTSATQHVTVQWYMDFHLRWYPWEKFSSLLLEKMYGLKIEKGLTDLKRMVESSPGLFRP